MQDTEKTEEESIVSSSITVLATMIKGSESRLWETRKVSSLDKRNGEGRTTSDMGTVEHSLRQSRWTMCNMSMLNA